MPPTTRSVTRARSVTQASSSVQGPANGSEPFRRELADQETADQQLWFEQGVVWTHPAPPSPPGFFSGVNKWLAFLLLLVVAALSLGLAHWSPVGSGLSSSPVGFGLSSSPFGSGFSSSSSARCSCPSCPSADIAALINDMNDAIKQHGLDMDRVDGLEDRIEKVREELHTLDLRLEELKRKGTEKPAARQAPVRQINWLSFDLGARAISHQSSPTKYSLKAQPLLPIKKGGWSLLGAFLPRRPQPVVEAPSTPPASFANLDYGPNAALQPWKEHEPKYCTEGRKMQLAARLPRAIAPKKLVLEYYLKDEVLAVGPAPKEFELWIPVSDPAARAAVVRMITSRYPDIMNEQRAGTGRFPGLAESLDQAWVPIGRWTYDVHAQEIAQSFTVPVELESLGIAVQEAAVRVNSNWGNKATTCLVRARLHGTDQSGLVDRLEAP
ncbi:hypothetical protein MMC07_008844 [Pseudocyphellaria aurata]|nr:hypothetical protein [Pseudocyphellaria aurata]